VLLRARLRPYKHAILRGYISYEGLQEPKQIAFLIDTGCTVTTILPSDIIRLGINCNKLPLSSTVVRTGSGNIRPHIMSNVALFFQGRSGFLNLYQGFLSFTLDEIQCVRPATGFVYNPVPVAQAPSILGMDFLSTFSKWKFTESHLILKT